MSDAETQLIQELRALAGPTKGDSFELVHGGVRIRVKYTSGSSSSVVLSVPYDDVARGVREGAGYRGLPGLAAIRPMQISLGRETDTHRMGKETGIDVEFQTGDAGFDQAVYVDTLTPPEVLARVLEADARRAIRDLLELEFTSIVIDNASRDIAATLVSFTSLRPAEPSGARAVDAFARLACAMPQVAGLDGAHPVHPLRGTNVALGVAAFVSFFGGMPMYFGVIADGRCPDGMSGSQVATCFGPGISGVVVGVVVGAITGVLASGYTRRYRGRSDSSRHGATFAWLTAMIALSVTALLVSSLIASRR